MSSLSLGATPLLLEAAEAIDYLLEKVFRLPLRKALDPNDPSDFLKISAHLADALRGLSGPAEALALRAALQTLDVDWKGMSNEQRAKVVAASKRAVNPADKVLPKLGVVFEANASSIGDATVAGTSRRFGFNIAPKLPAVSQRVLQHVASSQVNYVRDEYGRRSEAFSEKARKVVADGLAAGLSRTELADKLAAELGAQQLNRSKNYWNVVAGAFANRARSFSNLSGFQAAGVTTFTFQAVRDERTSMVCRLMHGRKFEVTAALDTFARAAQLTNPEDIRDVQPWLSEGKDADGAPIIYARGAGGQRETIAHVARATTAVDDVGEFKNAMSDGALAKRGIMTPPLHGHCRSTIVPDVRVPTFVPPAMHGGGAAPVTAPAPPPPAGQPAGGPQVLPAGGSLEAPVPPANRTPDEFANGLNNALQNFEKRGSAATAAERSQEAQKRIREEMRAYVSDALGGAKSGDDVTPRRDAYVVQPKQVMGGAAGAHGQDGAIELSREYHKKLVAEMKDISSRGGPSAFSKNPGQAEQAGVALSVLIHEEVHGFSKMGRDAYKGVGIGIEECQTEILARKLSREFFGFKESTGKVPFGLPERRGAVGTPYSGGYGAYQDLIGGLLGHVGDALGHPKDIGGRVEAAFMKLVNRTERFADSTEHIDGFVDALGITDKKVAAALRTKLKDPLGPLAPRPSPRR